MLYVIIVLHRDESYFRDTAKVMVGKDMCCSLVNCFARDAGRGIWCPAVATSRQRPGSEWPRGAFQTRAAKPRGTIFARRAPAPRPGRFKIRPGSFPSDRKCGPTTSG